MDFVILRLYELPSIKIDGNSEQIFYVNRALSLGELPFQRDVLEEGGPKPLKEHTL
jgi:hypothetical protein